MAYSGLTTKIRAMQAKLLTQADYETISGFTDVVQVVEFLKTKPAYAVYNQKYYCINTYICQRRDFLDSFEKFPLPFKTGRLT